MQQLNPEQLKASLQLDGNLLIIASAGTGKTTTIVERYINLINSGVKPNEILMTTFTNKAANDMINKITKKTNKISDYIGTMHSLFLRILRDNKDIIFNGKERTLITESTEQKKIVREVLENVGLPVDYNSTSYFLSWIGKFKNRGILADDLSWEGGIDEAKKAGHITEMLDDELILVDSMWRGQVNKVYKKYQEYLKLNNLMDFDEILLLTYKLFKENEELRESYKKQFKSIMVDEAQDLNVVQIRILELLRNDNLCLIGDDCQNIYEWRGSSNDLIFNFTENENKIFLDKNYRSSNEIIKSVNKTIVSMNNKIDKELVGTRGDNKRINIKTFRTSNEELDFIVEEIKDLIRNGENEEDIAVLFRTNMIGKSAEREFRRRGIPCHLSKSISFFDREEIKDIISFFKLIVNPSSGIDADRVLSMIKGFGKTKVKKVLETSKEKNITPIEVIKNYDTLGFKEDLNDKLKTIAKSLESNSPLESFLEEFGYYAYLENKYSQEIRKLEEKFQNIRVLIDMFEDFMEDNKTITDFLDSLIETGKREKTRNKVILTTIHGAKGLEWKHVYIIAVSEGILPFYKTDLAAHKRDSELRLFYVAISRAKDTLTLTSARAQGFRFTKPSQFLEIIYEDEFTAANNYY